MRCLVCTISIIVAVSGCRGSQPGPPPSSIAELPTQPTPLSPPPPELEKWRQEVSSYLPCGIYLNTSMSSPAGESFKVESRLQSLGAHVQDSQLVAADGTVIACSPHAATLDPDDMRRFYFALLSASEKALAMTRSGAQLHVSPTPGFTFQTSLVPAGTAP